MDVADACGAADLARVEAYVKGRCIASWKPHSKFVGRVLRGVTCPRSWAPGPAFSGDDQLLPGAGRGAGGLRGLSLLGRITAIRRMWPGAAVTLALLWRLAWTAAGTLGTDLLSHGLAKSALSHKRVLRQFAAALPGSGLTALRLKRLAAIAARACLPTKPERRCWILPERRGFLAFLEQRQRPNSWSEWQPFSNYIV